MGIDRKTLIFNLLDIRVGEVLPVETALQGFGKFVTCRVEVNVMKVLTRLLLSLVGMARDGTRNGL